jgi:hypothetical protein
MKTLFGAAVLAAIAGVASADIHVGDAQLKASWTAGEALNSTRVVDPWARYSNVTNFTGQGSVNGGAATGNAITRLEADDINMTAALPTVTNIVFSVLNLNTLGGVSARPRLRFWAADGVSGGPGSLIGGFTFNPITFNANSANLYFFNPSATANFALPQNFWAGMTFDNVGGTASVAALNNLGQLIFNPVDVGSSADVFFETTAAGSNFVSNPAGSFLNFGGNPAANFGWEFVPAPSSLALVGLGALVAGRRRR